MHDEIGLDNDRSTYIVQHFILVWQAFGPIVQGCYHTMVVFRHSVSIVRRTNLLENHKSTHHHLWLKYIMSPGQITPPDEGSHLGNSREGSILSDLSEDPRERTGDLDVHMRSPGEATIRESDEEGSEDSVLLSHLEEMSVQGHGGGGNTNRLPVTTQQTSSREQPATAGPRRSGPQSPPRGIPPTWDDNQKSPSVMRDRRR